MYESEERIPSVHTGDVFHRHRIMPRTITRRIEATQDTTSPRGAFMNLLPTIGELEWEMVPMFGQTSANQG